MKDSANNRGKIAISRQKSVKKILDGKFIDVYIFRVKTWLNLLLIEHPVSNLRKKSSIRFVRSFFFLNEYFSYNSSETKDITEVCERLNEEIKRQVKQSDKDYPSRGGRGGAEIFEPQSY